MVKLKKKVTIKTKKSSEPKGSIWKKVLIVISALVVVGLLAWGVLKCSKEQPTIPEGAGEVVLPIHVVDEPSPDNTIAKDSEDDTVKKDSTEETIIETVEIKPQNPISAPPQTTQPVSNDVEKEAINVIRGDYGNVPERRERLGNRYQTIQNRVNQLKKEGFF